MQGDSTIAAEEIFEAKKEEMSKTQSEKECRIAIAVEGKALQEDMQGGTAIVAEETKSGQKITKKKAKKDHKDKHRSERWYPPGYQPKEYSPEEMEIMLNYCTVEGYDRRYKSQDVALQPQKETRIKGIEEKYF
jgi:hypothetical protein